jgi:alkanesulfonate monooxygenase SsuD/methylene tetrahydromethanopterin reductase-like flavin-dependent oxidoreductase (luciferase family)
MGLPMIVGLIGGLPSDVAQAFRAHRAAAQAAGHDPATLGTGTSSHMHIAPTSQAARDTFYPHYARWPVAVDRSTRARSSLDARSAESPGAEGPSIEAYSR